MTRCLCVAKRGGVIETFDASRIVVRVNDDEVKLVMPVSIFTT